MTGDIEDTRIEDHDATDDGSVVVDLTKTEKPNGEAGKDASTNDDGSDRNVDVAKLQARMKEIEDRANARSATDRKAREAAEAETVKAKTEVHAVKSSLMTSELHTITNALAAEKARGDAFERDLEAAYTTGSPKDIAAIQRKMSQSDARMQTLEEGARRLDHNIKTRPAEPVIERAPSDESNEDAADAMISKVKNPRTQDFLRDRKDWLRDPKLHAKMVGLHHIAVSEGHTVDSQDYLDYIDQNMAAKKISRDRDEDTGNRDRDRDRGDAGRRAVSAPVSRDSHSDMRAGSVRLSAEERDIARAQGYSDAEWGRLKVQADRLKGKDGIVRFSRDQLN